MMKLMPESVDGRAQKVSEKLKLLSKSHQILCITHLARNFAAMADTHFLIEKMVDENDHFGDSDSSVG